MLRTLLARIFGCLFLVAAVAAQVPSPLAFLGHEIGADRRLCSHTDLLRYFEAVALASDRVRLLDIGTTSYGRRMVMAAVTSPDNHRRLEELRGISTRLCRARDDEATARALVEQGRAVVWIDAGLHATEAIAGQNILELVWQMASRQDEEVLRILDEVVLLACPVNPDGLELVAKGYAATGKLDPPILYQRYVGHDNNRDFYACNMQETRHVSRVFFTDWCPQIVYNHHQTAPAGTILFTPPFRDPFNYSADPGVMRGIDWVAAAMNRRFASERKPGVISRGGAPYSGWWNGGLRSTCYFHNIIGILTEAFGRPEPTKIVQTLDRRLSSGEYPDPVPTQVWHARQTVEYLQTANFAILDHAARYRRELLSDIWRMGRNSIERGSRDHWTPTPRLVAEARAREAQAQKGEGGSGPADPGEGAALDAFADPGLRDPRAYVLPMPQRDSSAALRFALALARSGVEVHELTAPAVVAGRTCEAGSLVILCAQAFRPHVLDMFEPQAHPDDIKDGKPVPPYDSAGWTLALQHGVDVVRIRDEWAAELRPWAGDARPADLVVGECVGWAFDPSETDAVIAVNRLLAAAVRVERLQDGRWFVPQADGAAMAILVALRGLHADVAPAPLAFVTEEARAPMRLPRIGLFDVWGGNMPTGWTEWLLREFEFPVQVVFADRIEQGSLRADFDALIFHTGLPGGRDLRNAGPGPDAETLARLAEALPPFEDWKTLGSRAQRLQADAAWPALREFVEQGGTLMAFAGECEKVIRRFELPIEVGVHVDDAAAEGGRRKARSDEFYVPGSLLAGLPAAGHPLTVGCAGTVAVMFTRSSVVLRPDGEAAQALVSYREHDTLLSGWGLGLDRVRGAAAVATASYGNGRILLFGADALYRGQPLATIRIFLHGLRQSGAQ